MLSVADGSLWQTNSATIGGTFSGYKVSKGMSSAVVSTLV